MHARPLLVFGVVCIALSGATLLFSRYVNIQESTVNSPTSNPLLYAEITASSSPNMPLVLPKEILLPILVYHVVRPSYPSDSAAIRAIALTPENFNAEMKYLGDAGYHVVRFSDLEAYFASGTPLPSKPIILSFDDGWSDQFKYAFPILEKYHYPVTFFVFTNAIGHRGFLTWDQLRQLMQAGMTIGDHTRSHPYLTMITSTSTLWNEIAGSKRLLEQKLGVSINEFAYPFGLYNANLLTLVKAAGYKSARGDYYHEGQSLKHLFDLPALNAPTSLALFRQRFP